MIVFAFPPAADTESAPYLLRGTQYEGKTPAGDLLVVPKGACAPAGVSVPVFCMEENAPGGTVVPEALAGQRPGDFVWVCSRLSGGTLESRLRQALRRYEGRVYLRVEPFCTRFAMPCPTGEAIELTQEQSARLQAQFPVFYSPELCCNYCVATENGNASMILFDTPQTIAKKLALAQSMGVPYVFGEIPLAQL